uniref:Nanos-type domain-containing protein n=1 Tax=Hucho hucho TaxID=62062 RepID=A0A4W5N7S1_9TELE
VTHLILGLQHLPPYMEPENKSFQPWRDYMKLVDLVREMQLGKFTSEPTTVDGHDSGICSTMITPVATPPLRHEMEPLDSEIVPLRKGAPLCLCSTKRVPSPLQQRPDPVRSPELKFCSFCKHNGKSESVFAAHSLKDQDGDVMCPYLQLRFWGYLYFTWAPKWLNNIYHKSFL